MIFLIIAILMLVAVLTIGKNYKTKNNHHLLVLFCIFLTIYTGFRPQLSDTLVYVLSFLNTPNIFEVSLNDHIPGYNEKGYYILSSLIKTISDDPIIYLLVVGGLTMFFIYKALDDKDVFLPVLGLFIYMCRFLAGRNFTQLRSGIAIAIIMFSIKYVKERKIWHFLFVWFIAYMCHRSMILALPLYFMNRINLKKWHVLSIIGLAFVLGISFTTFLHGLIQDAQSEMDLGIEKYIEGGERRYVEGTGFSNPMIYFQLIILLAYTYYEDKLKAITSDYHFLRNGYLYSTFLIIALCSYKVLCGRSSTIFATFEIFIIPQLVLVIGSKKNVTMLLGTVAIMSVFFFYNFREYI